MRPSLVAQNGILSLCVLLASALFEPVVGQREFEAEIRIEREIMERPFAAQKLGGLLDRSL